MGLFPPGAGIAVSPQFRNSISVADRTALFLVDLEGTLNGFWVHGENQWVGPFQIGPPFAFVPGSTPVCGNLYGDGNIAVFLVDAKGQLTLFWAEGELAWQGPIPIGPAGHFPPGATPAVSPQFGVTQLDVFLIDKNGRLVVFWGGVPDGWNGPQALSGPVFTHQQVPQAAQRIGVEPLQTDVFVIDDLGDVNVFSVVGSGQWSSAAVAATGQDFDYGARFAVGPRAETRDNLIVLVDRAGFPVFLSATANGGWSGPVSIGENAVAMRGGSTARSFQYGVPAQTDVFLIDRNGQLDVFWVGPEGGWNGPEKLSAVGMAIPTGGLAASAHYGVANRTDVFLVDARGDLLMFFVEGSGRWQSAPVPVAPATPPSGGLQGPSNYILYNNCNRLSNVVVDISLTEDMTAVSDDGPTKGFGFQLNAFSSINNSLPPNLTMGWQQFFLYLNGKNLYWTVNLWDPTAKLKFVFSGEVLHGYPGPTLPAYTSLQISLGTDNNLNVSTAEFSVFYPGGVLANKYLANLVTIPRFPGYSAVVIAPIVAFTVNVVGPLDGESATLSTGAGIITCTQSGGPLIALPAVPACANTAAFTGENANTVYSTLPATAQKTMFQTFSLR